MKHARQVGKYEGTHDQLAEDLGDLYYDSLADFLRMLATKIEEDGEKDAQRGRIKLAKTLHGCSAHLQQAAADIDRAWEICEPYMKE